jgi:oligosaccharide repeat unit polymerase
MIALMLGLCVILLISYKMSGLFSPSTVFCLIWFFDILAQIIMNYYIIELQTQISVGLLVLCFSLGSLSINKIKMAPCRFRWSSRRLQQSIMLIFWLILAMIPLIYLELRNNVGFNPSNFARAVRLYFLNKSINSGNSNIPFKIITNFSIIMIVLIFIDQQMSKVVKSLLVLFGLTCIAISFSKGYFVLLMGFLSSIVIFYVKKKLRVFLLLIIFLILVLVLSAVFRDKIAIGTYFRIYLLSSLPAFQMIVHGDFNFPFPTLFGYLRPIYSSLGIHVDTPTGSNFVEVPEYTNVFTIFGPVMSDYGLVFSLIYFFINGLLSSCLFRLANSDNPIYKIMYGFVLFILFSSVFSDGFALWSTFIGYFGVFLSIHVFIRVPNQAIISEPYL